MTGQSRLLKTTATGCGRKLPSGERVARLPVSRFGAEATGRMEAVGGRIFFAGAGAFGGGTGACGAGDAIDEPCCKQTEHPQKRTALVRSTTTGWQN